MKIQFVVAGMVVWRLLFVTMGFCRHKMMSCFLHKVRLYSDGQLKLELYQDKILVGGTAVTCIDGSITL